MSDNTADLFDKVKIRGVTVRNRIGVPPMCQFSCTEDGMPTDWHLQHLLSRAAGGAGLVIVEATSVSPIGRISPQDLGIWDDHHIAGHSRIAKGIAAFGAVPVIQLAHAGRKASRKVPWEGEAPAEKGWVPVAPSAIPYAQYETPKALTEEEIASTIEDFVKAAKRSVVAGYQAIEVHSAHGYLLHEFLSPLTNQRTDSWGGSLAGRCKMTVSVAKAVRAAIPADMPLLVRISHTDWVEGGWTTDQAVELCKMLKEVGVDMVDVSSAGLHPAQQIPVGPGFQVPGAERIRKEAGIPVAAVGLITGPAQAQEIVAKGRADIVLIGRAVLRDPYWAYHAAVELGKLKECPTLLQLSAGWNTTGQMPIAPYVAMTPLGSF